MFDGHAGAEEPRGIERPPRRMDLFQVGFHAANRQFGPLRQLEGKPARAAAMH